MVETGIVKGLVDSFREHEDATKPRQKVTSQRARRKVIVEVERV